MTQPPQAFDLDTIDHLTVEDNEGQALLIVDRIVNPSGHWVLTVSSGDDVELFQMHTADSPAGPRSPVDAVRLRIEDSDGRPLAELEANLIRTWGTARRQ